ncbi:gamma-glutamylcyclotransferase family protein [Synoicihabitans lomoniglobus]|uniref:Gamma-glutamylcyclotransferase n=1 Tax=Synoicihabitans lomoniglobus TaxID=2909285 RepID=A0AAF0CQ12_9BACT|nr:gamma-glutamylcyclotransferase [Opitutaceae bacterium LMO-M01]WED65929.1 gamma-glutamylcyclotransferase [Opitutaceae bacterium LMO-M01]
MSAKDSSILFFAYGLKMDEKRMMALDADCELMGTARLDGYRFEFTAQGHANLQADPESKGWGILWLVPARQMEALDAWAKSRGFERTVLFVISPAGPRVPATAFINLDGTTGSPDPAEWTEILAAARTAKLERSYLTHLKSLSPGS